MYIFLENIPTNEDIKKFKMFQTVNENYINFKIDPNQLSTEDKQTLIKKYKLRQETLRYKEHIFLSISILQTKENNVRKKQCI